MPLIYKKNEPGNLKFSTHEYFSYRRVFKKGSFYKPLDISGKSWDWGSIPFLRASKLEMSHSGILVKRP